MTKNLKVLYGVILLLIVVRILAMVTLPLTDTTEARYAHTAYLMALTDNWVTPFYDIGIPFWGKPPFSFWAEAVSYKIFGLHDFTARIPALIFTLLTGGLIYRYLETFYSKLTALWGVIVYLSLLVVYALSGAVLTDPYFTFATTLSMVSFIMAVRERETYWGYFFFVGLAIGLLAKGPLAMVLIGGALVFWILFDFKQRLSALKVFPWFNGILLTLLLSLPWYILAEMRTPGFLDYFIIGEHFKRFLDPGWSGDLYGTAHVKPHGAIWLMWLASAFPWVLVVLYTVAQKSYSPSRIAGTLHLLKENREIGYFVMWSIFTMIFFTFSGNVLWTYVLPALPALAVLLAIYLEKMDYKLGFGTYNLIAFFVLFAPAALVVTNFYVAQNPDVLRTEKQLVAHYLSKAEPAEKLYYIESRPFSAQYYSNDRAVLVTIYEEDGKQRSNSIPFKLFEEEIEQSTHKNFIAFHKKKLTQIQSKIKKPMTKLYENKRYALYELQP